MPPARREDIKAYLVQRDRCLRPLLTRLDFPVARRNRDIYASLIYSIISQQLSVRAADTIHARVMALFTTNYPDPMILNRMPVNRLRAVGLSRQKAGYLKAVARFALDHGIDYEQLRARDDTHVIEYLTQIHGVGRWTVEMLLIFNFNRPDVFAVDDVGIQNAMSQLYNLEHKGRELKRTMLEIAENWRPYRAIVSRYLWRWKAAGYTLIL